jgi:hypothetical protein
MGGFDTPRLTDRVFVNFRFLVTLSKRGGIRDDFLLGTIVSQADSDDLENNKIR